MIPATFWIDIQFEIESVLDVRVVSLGLLPFPLARWGYANTWVLHIIHEPKLQVHKDICRFTPANQYKVNSLDDLEVL